MTEEERREKGEVGGVRDDREREGERREVGGGKRRRRRSERGGGEVLSAQHSKLTCSMYCQYLKYDTSQGV